MQEVKRLDVLKWTTTQKLNRVFSQLNELNNDKRHLQESVQTSILFWTVIWRESEQKIVSKVISDHLLQLTMLYGGFLNSLKWLKTFKPVLKLE